MTDEKKFIVKDYMRKEVNTINKDANFLDAMETMFKERRNGLVVIDKDNKVCGMLSSLHLIKWIVPDYLEDDKHLAAFEANDVLAKRVHEVKKDKITKFMNPEFHPVKAEDTLMEAATLMSEWNTRHLPVVDDSGSLIGYITRTDIKRAIAEILELSRPDNE